MFTPPPSPEPSSHLNCSVPDLHSSAPSAACGEPLSVPPSVHVDSACSKRSSAHRTKWTILLVPAVLILITASTRYISHPVALDAFSDSSPQDMREWASTLLVWRQHKPHAVRDLQLTDSTIVFPSASSSAVSSTIETSTPTSTSSTPSVPSTPPVLPTPFPQPWDTAFSSNYSDSCLAAMQNMTQSLSFRSCRPFSLLEQFSSEFITAQTNITELNTFIWGTCNTSTDIDQCEVNMKGFSDQLQTACAEDISNQNAIITETLAGLDSYTFLRNAACLEDSTTIPNETVYCYIEAVQSPDASDINVYQLPVGGSLPNGTMSCSPCTQEVMNLFVQQVGNSSVLKETYAPAADLMNSMCGTGYVQAISNEGSPSSAAILQVFAWTVASTVGVTWLLLMM